MFKYIDVNGYLFQLRVTESHFRVQIIQVCNCQHDQVRRASMFDKQRNLSSLFL